MLYIITPCSRPFNLLTIEKTIPDKCKWIIVYDNRINIPNNLNATTLLCDDTGRFGVKGRNYALNNISFNDEDSILFHDDDNIIHPKLYTTIEQYLNIDYSIITWGQLFKNNKIRLVPTHSPRVNHIDTASYLVKWKYNKQVRHNINDYQHDGKYAFACFKNGPLICINDYLCYYNFLRKK